MEIFTILPEPFQSHLQRLLLSRNVRCSSGVEMTPQRRNAAAPHLSSFALETSELVSTPLSCFVLFLFKK